MRRKEKTLDEENDQGSFKAKCAESKFMWRPVDKAVVALKLLTSSCPSI